jgi:hypothetical protein
VSSVKRVKASASEVHVDWPQERLCQALPTIVEGSLKHCATQDVIPDFIVEQPDRHNTAAQPQQGAVLAAETPQVLGRVAVEQICRACIAVAVGNPGTVEAIYVEVLHRTCTRA